LALAAGGGDRRNRLLDQHGELVDLAAEGVDLVQQHPRQLCVMIVEAAGEGLHQGGVLDAEPSSGQLGQHLRIALAGDQRLQHGPARDAEDVGGHRGKLDQGVHPAACSSRCLWRERSAVRSARSRV
jgi:hypothetical protein